MVNSVVINDVLMEKLKLESNRTGLNVSDLLEKIIFESLEESGPICVKSYDDIKPFLEYDRDEPDTSFDNLIGKY